MLAISLQKGPRDWQTRVAAASLSTGLCWRSNGEPLSGRRQRCPKLLICVFCVTF